MMFTVATGGKTSCGPVAAKGVGGMGKGEKRRRQLDGRRR